MMKHEFIFSPTSWIGDGKIQLNMVDEELGFVTRWSVVGKDSTGKIECVQEIQVKGLSDMMQNQFSFSNFNGTNFLIEMENAAVGKVAGTGIISPSVIGWEFRIPEIGFEGFEFYEKQQDGSYLMRAEYATTDQFRTLIRGKVWVPTAKEEKEYEKDHPNPEEAP